MYFFKFLSLYIARRMKSEWVLYMYSLELKLHTTFNMNKWAGKWKDISFISQINCNIIMTYVNFSLQDFSFFTLCYFVFHFWKFNECRLSKMIVTWHFLCLHFFHSSGQELVFSQEVGIKSIDQRFTSIIIIFWISINSSIEMNFNAFNDWHHRIERASKTSHQSCMAVLYPDTC